MMPTDKHLHSIVTAASYRSLFINVCLASDENQPLACMYQRAQTSSTERACVARSQECAAVR
eukprot:8320-Heterococcus_DN1.PRE.5